MLPFFSLAELRIIFDHFPRRRWARTVFLMLWLRTTSTWSTCTPLPLLCVRSSPCHLMRFSGKDLEHSVRLFSWFKLSSMSEILFTRCFCHVFYYSLSLSQLWIYVCGQSTVCVTKRCCEGFRFWYQRKLITGPLLQGKYNISEQAESSAKQVHRWRASSGNGNVCGWSRGSSGVRYLMRSSIIDTGITGQSFIFVALYFISFISHSRYWNVTVLLVIDLSQEFFERIFR